MELRLPAGPQSHSCDDLALFHRVALRNNQLVVVPVGTEIGIVVLDDQELSVADQTVSRVNDPTGGRGSDVLTDLTADADTLTSSTPRTVRGYEWSLHWPAPTGCGQLRWQRRWLSRRTRRGRGPRRPAKPQIQPLANKD